MCSNYPGIKFDHQFADWKEKLKDCQQVLESITPLQNRSYRVIGRTKMRFCTCNGVINKSVQKLLLFIVNMQLCDLFITVMVA